MVGFIKRLFGVKAEYPTGNHPPRRVPVPAPPVRKITHPRDLQVNDILRFTAMAHKELSGKRLQVTHVSTYQFGDLYPTFTLHGENGQPYFLATSHDEEREYLTISKPIKRQDLGRLFNLELFAELFEEKEGAFYLERLEEPADLSGWTASGYFLSVDALKGSFFRADLRGRATPPSSGGEGLDYYMLLDEKETRTLEVEVYDNGETEVALGLRLPVDIIAEFWSAS